jgi:hypothetical protein
MCFPSASFNHALKFISFPVDAGILLGHIRQSRGRHYAAIPIENPVGWGRILRRQAGGKPPSHTHDSCSAQVLSPCVPGRMDNVP